MACPAPASSIRSGEWDGERLRGWIATGRTPIKAAGIDATPHVSLTYWDDSHDTCTADCRAEWVPDEQLGALWRRFAEGPEPVGYDPAIIPAWADGPASAAFDGLALDPYRLRLMPGSLMLTGQGEVAHLAGVSLASRARVLRTVVTQPRLRRLIVGFGCFSLLEHGCWLAVLVYAYGRGGVGEAAVAALVQLAPAALVAPVAAVAGDRASRVRVLVGSFVAQALAAAAVAVAMLVDAPAVAVYAAATLLAVTITFSRPAMSSLLPTVTTTPTELTAANVVGGLVENVGRFAGPLLAGLIIHLGEPGTVYAAAALMMGAAAALVASVPATAAAVAADDGLEETPRQALLAGFPRPAPRTRSSAPHHRARCRQRGRGGARRAVRGRGRRPAPSRGRGLGPAEWGGRARRHSRGGGGRGPRRPAPPHPTDRRGGLRSWVPRWSPSPEPTDCWWPWRCSWSPVWDAPWWGSAAAPCCRASPPTTCWPGCSGSTRASRWRPTRSAPSRWPRSRGGSG